MTPLAASARRGPTFRNRDCSPALTRFLDQSPLGFGGGDDNFYGYVRNNPVNWTDPTGQELFAYGTDVAEYLEKALGTEKRQISGTIPPPPYDVKDFAQAQSGLPLYLLVPTQPYSEAKKQSLGNSDSIYGRGGLVPLYEAMYNRQSHMIAWKDKAAGRWWHSRAVDVYGSFTPEQREQIYNINQKKYGSQALKGIVRNMATAGPAPETLWGEWKITYCTCTKANSTLLGHAFIKLEKNNQVYTVDVRPGQAVQWCAGDLLIAGEYEESPFTTAGTGGPLTYFNPNLWKDFQWEIGGNGTCYTYAASIYWQERVSNPFNVLFNKQRLGGVLISE